MKFMLTLVIVCYAFFAQAQHKFDWSKYNSLPFFEDKETVFPFWSFEKDVLPPIKESKADMEVRCYSFGHGGSKAILTMQGFGDSLVFKALNRTINGDWPIPVSKDDSGLYENGGNYYNWNIEELVVNKEIENIMDKLIQKGLFTLNKADSIKDAVRRKYASYNNCDSLQTAVRYGFDDNFHTGFLIKINNRYRTFVARGIRYTDEKLNDERFIFGGELLKVFRSFFMDKKIANTQDFVCRSTEH
jgi:hypothetical protein